MADCDWLFLECPGCAKLIIALVDCDCESATYVWCGKCYYKLGLVKDAGGTDAKSGDTGSA